MVVKDRLQAGRPFRRLADPGDAGRDGSCSRPASAGILPGEGPVVEHAPHRDDAVRVDGVDHVLPEPDGCADAGESDQGRLSVPESVYRTITRSPHGIISSTVHV